VYILVGVTPLKSLKMAQYMHNEVPGVFIPEPLLKRMEAAGDGAQEEGVQIALEQIEQIKGKAGDQWSAPDGRRLGRDRAAHRSARPVCCRRILSRRSSRPRGRKDLRQPDRLDVG